MREYVIRVPLRSNAGDSYAEAREAFEARLLELAGGWSALAYRGAWVDAVCDGTIYRETTIAYEVALDPAADNEWSAIIASAKRLFPDQRCFYVKDGNGNVELI